MLPTIDFCGKKVTRLICGGNPVAGNSHVSDELDWEMRRYFTMANTQALLDACWKNGINTYQSRGDKFQIRVYLEHREKGGKMHWIAQTASERRDIIGNAREIAEFGAIGVYHHGTHTDNCWHDGTIDTVRDIVKGIKDAGLPAGIGTHIPEVIEYIEEKGWETDFYMGCFYRIAKGKKRAPEEDPDPYAEDRFVDDDVPRMARTLSQVKKPCLGFKILAASRKCGSEESIKAAFKLAYDNIKPNDAVVVGMFPKYKDQVAENAAIVRELLAG